MYCPNCGRENPDGVGFCGGCGMSFAANAPAPAAPAPAAPAPEAPQPVAAAPAAPAPAALEAPQPAAAAPVAPAPAAPQPAPAAPQPAPAAAPVVSAAQPQPVQQPAPAQPKQPSDMLPFGQHFKNLIKAAVHPATGPVEIVSQYDKIGNAIFLAGIVVVICSVVGCFTSLSVDLYYFIRYPNVYDDLIVGMILKDVFYPFIVYAIRTFGCAGLMLLAGLIFKEKYSFARMLALASMAVAPAYIAKEFLGTYLGLIPHVRMGTLITTAAYIYYIFMLYKGIGAESKLKDDKKAFVLIGVFAIVGVLAGLFSY